MILIVKLLCTLFLVSNVDAQNQDDWQTEMAVWWSDTQEVVGDMLKTWSQRHEEEYKFWNGGALQNSSFVEAIVNGSEEIKNTIEKTLDVATPLMQDLSNKIEEVKNSDKQAKDDYTSQINDSQLRKNITQAMQDITDVIKQGYQAVTNELASAQNKISEAQGQATKDWFNKKQGQYEERYYAGDAMSKLASSASEGMKIVTNQFKNVTDTVKAAADEAAEQFVPEQVRAMVNQTMNAAMQEEEMLNLTEFRPYRGNSRCANYKIRGQWTRTWTTADSVQACADECMERAGGNCNFFSFSEKAGNQCLYNVYGCRIERWGGGYTVYEPLN